MSRNVSGPAEAGPLTKLVARARTVDIPRYFAYQVVPDEQVAPTDAPVAGAVPATLHFNVLAL